MMSRKNMLIMAMVGIAGMSSATLLLHNTLDTDNIVDGTNVLDLAGAPENGTLNGTWIENAGQINECIWTGNRTGYVDYGNVHNPYLGSQTVSLWAKWGGFGSTRIMSSHGNIGSSSGGWTIIEAGGQIIMRTADTDGHRAGTSSATGAVPSGEWVHVALVIDRDADKIIGYVNGSNAGFTPGGWGPSTDSLTGIGDIYSTQSLMLGADASGGNYGIGGLDDFAIFDRALSESEIDTIYQNGLAGIAIPEPTTLLYFALGSGPMLLIRKLRM